MLFLAVESAPAPWRVHCKSCGFDWMYQYEDLKVGFDSDWRTLQRNMDLLVAADLEKTKTGVAAHQPLVAADTENPQLDIAAEADLEGKLIAGAVTVRDLD